jgi:hypothetical protein
MKELSEMTRPESEYWFLLPVVVLVYQHLSEDSVSRVQAGEFAEQL